MPDIFFCIFARKGHILIQRWIDKKDVCVISIRHNDDFEVRAKFGPSKLKPKAIVEYNKFMGGVDKADQLTSYYSTPRKTIKWQLKVFFSYDRFMFMEFPVPVQLIEILRIVNRANSIMRLTRLLIVC